MVDRFVGEAEKDIEYEAKVCLICGTPLIQNERKLCSICASSKEHRGDLGWQIEE